MSELALRPVRQWVTLRQGSLDARLGTGIITKVAQDLKTAVGRPKICIIAYVKGADKKVVEKLTRQLTNTGFKVEKIKMAKGANACTLKEVETLWEEFEARGITSDDACCVIGDTSAISVASFACGRWRQGMPLAAIALDMDAAIEAAIAPRSLDFGAIPEVLNHQTSVKIAICDSDLVAGETHSEPARRALMHMVAGAITDDEKAFGRLWDRAEKMASNDAEAIYAQLADSMRTRGRVVGSTSIAVRQAANFCFELLPSMRKLMGSKPQDSELLAEVLRFLTRLGVAEAGLAFDDMLAVDELLEILGFPELEVSFGGKKMTKVIREDRFAQMNRCMLMLPQALGKVRLTAVSEDVLLEHASAWCDARS